MWEGEKALELEGWRKDRRENTVWRGRGGQRADRDRVEEVKRKNYLCVYA